MKLDITNEFGALKLGDVLVPGIYQGCEIRGNVKLDEIDVPGQSGKSTQPLGFEDATIALRMTLTNDENSSPYDKVKTIVKLFQATDKKAKPYIYRIVNQLTSIWGIKEVIFRELAIADSNSRDYIYADINLREYKPAIVKKETKTSHPTKQEKSTKKDPFTKKGENSNPFNYDPLEKLHRLQKLGHPASDVDTVMNPKPNEVFLVKR